MIKPSDICNIFHRYSHPYFLQELQGFRKETLYLYSRSVTSSASVLLYVFTQVLGLPNSHHTTDIFISSNEFVPVVFRLGYHFFGIVSIILPDDKWMNLNKLNTILYIRDASACNVQKVCLFNIRMAYIFSPYIPYLSKMCLITCVYFDPTLCLKVCASFAPHIWLKHWHPFYILDFSFFYPF